jgi:hypothetical protein
MGGMNILTVWGEEVFDAVARRTYSLSRKSQYGIPVR